MTLPVTLPPVETVATGRSFAVRTELWPASARSDAFELWSSLEAMLPPCPLACTRVWTETWLTHYGQSVEHHFVVLLRGETPCGIALLTRSQSSQHWPGVNVWHVGTAGEADVDSVCVEYNGLLCHEELREPFFSSISSTVSQVLHGHAVAWDGFATADLPIVDVPEPQATRQGKLARYFDLAALRATGLEPITGFGDSTRKGIRQNLRDYGTVHVEWADSVAAAHAIFDELIELHQQRWTAVGQPGCYASSSFTAFHRELIDRLGPKNQLGLVRVRAGGRTLGCTQLLIDRNRVLVYQGGRLQTAGKHSPGLIVDYQCLVESWRRGYDAYDFMAGDSLHKKRLTNRTATLVWREERWPNWRWTTRDIARTVRNRVRHFWQSTPAKKES